MENNQTITLDNISPIQSIDDYFPVNDIQSSPDFEEILFAVPYTEQKGFCLVYYQRGRCLVPSSLKALHEKLSGKYGADVFLMVGRSLMVSVLYLRIVQPGKQSLLLSVDNKLWIEIKKPQRTLSRFMEDVGNRIGKNLYDSEAFLNGYFSLWDSRRLIIFNGNEIKYIRTKNSMPADGGKSYSHSGTVVFFRNGTSMQVPFELGDFQKKVNGSNYKGSLNSVMINLRYVDIERSSNHCVRMDDGDTGIKVGEDISAFVWKNFITLNKPRYQAQGNSSFHGMSFITMRTCRPTHPTGFAIM